jgi:hypothetical protein
MPATRSTLPIGTKYHTSLRTEGELTIVRLYDTDIVKLSIRNGVVCVCSLDTGGFDTPTTFRRMNEALAHFDLIGPGRIFEHRVGKSDFIATNIITRTNEE